MVNALFIAVILLLPFQFALNLSENIDLVAVRLLVPAVFLLWLARGFTRKKIWVANRAETWLVLSFLFFSFFSLWTGLDAERGLRKMLYLFSLFPVYFVAADILRENKMQKWIARAVVASGFLAAVTGIIQFSMQFVLGLGKALAIWKGLAKYFLGSSFSELVIANSSWLVNVSGKTILRAFGFFPDPHMFSFFVSLCFFFALGYFLWEKILKWKIFAFAALVFMLFAVFFSFARGAYLGVATGALFFLAVLAARKAKLKKMLVGCAALSLALLVFFQGSIQGRLVSALDAREGSNAERLRNWRQAVEVARDFPLTGVGLGNYSSYIDRASGDRSSIYAHNIFLDVSAETGIFNGALFLALVIFGIFSNLRRGSFWGLGLASAFVYFFVHGIFDTPLWSPQVTVIFLILLAMGTRVNSPPKADQPMAEKFKI